MRKLFSTNRIDEIHFFFSLSNDNNTNNTKKNCKYLERMDLEECNQITDLTLAHLATGCPSLEKLVRDFFLLWRRLPRNSNTVSTVYFDIWFFHLTDTVTL